MPGPQTTTLVEPRMRWSLTRGDLMGKGTMRDYADEEDAVPIWDEERSSCARVRVLLPAPRSDHFCWTTTAN